jgi:hypothetical protein
MHAWLKENWLKTLAIVTALGAILPITLPFAYFQIMNWIVVIAALTTAWAARKEKNDVLAWVFVFVAVIFNPLAPLYFTPVMWQIADMIVALLFIATFFLKKNPPHDHVQI